MSSVPDDKVLVNFIMPKYLKKQFDELCKYKNLSKTHVMLTLIEKFLDDETKKLNINRNNIVDTSEDPIIISPISYDSEVKEFKF